MRKLLICLSLVLVLVLVFAACNKDGAADNTNDVTTAAPATPATDAPSTDAPATDAPVTDAPATDAPATDAPTTDAPATDAPVTDAPTTDAPATDAPVTDAPTTDAPATEPAECEHVYGEAVVTAPDCENDGLSVVTCTKCGDEVKTAIDAIGHKVADDAEWDIIVEPTCETIGLGFGLCVNCNNYVEAELAALGHNANEATCTAASVCATCGETVAEALAHNTVVVDAKAPTCTEVGYNAGTYCANCESIDALVIPAISHDYVWAVSVKPSFTAEGENKGTCKNCGDVVTEATAKRVPSLVYTAADMFAGENVNFKNVIVTAGAESDVPYVTLTPKAYGASISFLLAEGQKFGDVISVKYRVSADYVTFATNSDAYFHVNGLAFYGSKTGKNVVDYDNEATVGQWTLLNIDFRKSQITIDGVEYDMFNGAALETIEYVLFNGYKEGLSIDVSYVAFFDTVAEAEEYGSTQGEVATPVVIAPTEKNYTTSVDNLNGTGEYGAPGKFLNETNNVGVTVLDWNATFFNSLNLTVVGSITVEGGAQKLVYSLDGGLTWLDFAEGMATLNADGTYTAKFDFSAMEGKTVDLRIAAILGTDGKITEYASILNLKKLAIKKGNLNDATDINYVAAIANQTSGLKATYGDGYVHITASGKNPTITLYNDEANATTVSKYMLIKYRTDCTNGGVSYGGNYDFFLTVNGSKNVGGQKYKANWFNYKADNTWSYMIVDITNGGAINASTIKSISWTFFDGTVSEAKGTWIDLSMIKFFDSYDEARAVANPEGNFITEMENGSTFSSFKHTAYAAYNLATGTSKPTVVLGADSRFDSVTLTAPDYMFVFVTEIVSNVAITKNDVGIMIEGYGIMWDITNDLGGGKYQVGLPIPEDFVNGKAYTVSVVLKSKTNSEIVLMDTFTLTRLPEGVDINDTVGLNDGKISTGTTISVAASAGAANDVVALYKDGTLVMYYNAYAGPTGFTPNGGSNITIANQSLASLTSEGNYVVKLHKGSINGEVVDEATVQLLNAGDYTMISAADIYNTWKASWQFNNPGPANGYDWGLKVELKTDSDGSQYVTLTTLGTANIGCGRLFLAKQMLTYQNKGVISLRYRNNTNTDYYGYGPVYADAAVNVNSWSPTRYQTNMYANRSNWETCTVYLSGSITNMGLISFDFYTGKGDGRTVDLRYIVFCQGDPNSTEGSNIINLFG